MKLLIASDIHGSEKAARKLQEIYMSLQPDLLILCGDLLYHGPRNDLPDGYNPKGVIRILSELKKDILAVRGNCEAEVDQMVLPFPVLSQTAIVFADGKKLFITHGHSITPDHAPEGIDVFISGHTHIPVNEEKDGILFFNPGSTSLPKGGFAPSYGLWDEGKLSVRNLYTGERIL